MNKIIKHLKSRTVEVQIVDNRGNVVTKAIFPWDYADTSNIENVEIIEEDN